MPTVIPAPHGPTNPLQRRVFYGTAIHAVSLTETEYLSNTLIGVDEAGVITFVERSVAPDKLDERLQSLGWVDQAAQLVKLQKGEFLMPGLIDTHTHAPQHLNLAFGQQFELLDWLDKVTFPAEAKFADPAYARRTYDEVVRRAISIGTTTCCWYGTIHPTTKILAAICHRQGQRAFVGKCNMDRNSAPYYQESSAQQSLADTEDYVSFVRSHCDSPSLASSAVSPVKRSSAPTALVQPILTPRFAISCTDEVMQGLSEMMDRDEHLPLQTHLSENPAEIEFALSLYPGIASYTAVYDHFRLLRRNTVLAHCVHMSDDELSLIKQHESGISHCADSNFNLRSGTARVAAMLDKGIKVGLGTDVSGGLSLGVLSSIRAASTASKTICFHERESRSSSVPNGTTSSAPSAPPILSSDGQSRPAGFFASKHLSLETLFYLATLGGAHVCSIEDRVGNFVVGKEFDAILVQTGQGEAREDRAPAQSEAASLEDEVEKALAGAATEEESEGPGNPALLVTPDEPIERVFEKFLFAGDDRNMGTVFVRGRIIGGARPLASD
ncbi:guanine deaminase [Rhodotorula paludigena]|uniref:guanine deaminase n=1 Tax=Rhodotorula paludigena TaxID=86838 RepID=UPI003174D84D